MKNQEHYEHWKLKKIEKDGASYLGIPISRDVKKYFFGKFIEFKKSRGWLVRDDVITEWNIEGFYNQDEHSFFYGAYHEGLLLDELLAGNPDHWQEILLKLAKAYAALCTQIGRQFKVYTLAVYFLEDGGILFLPPDLMEEVVTLSKQEIKFKQKNIINHPDLDGEEAVSYTLGVISYHALTGEFPFTDSSEDDIRYKIRNQKLVPLYLTVPGLKSGESGFILSALYQSASRPPGINEWVERLSAWKAGGLYTAISDSEKTALAGKAGEKAKGLEKSFRFSLFMRKHKWTIITVTAVFLTAVLILSTSLYNLYFKPRTTKHLNPAELVLAYYKSFNTIDLYTLEDCVIKDAGKADINELTNLYVLTKQQSVMQYEKPMIDPEQWTKEGRPQLKPGVMLYGIRALSVKEQEPLPEPVYEVSYEKWYSEYSIEDRIDNPEIAYFGSVYKDRLYLKMDRGGWVIFRLDREVIRKFKYHPGQTQEEESGNE